jgi:uncharacterized HhH-GPD family protein
MVRWMEGNLAITGDEAADRLLNTNGTAALIGMLLDQQVPMEWAFRGPATLQERLGHLDAGRVAAMEEGEFVEVCVRKPAIHRFPRSMGERIYRLCVHLTDHYDADGAVLWSDDPDASTLYKRIRELPGFGEEKSRIFLALLAKRFGVAPEGWEELAGPFGDGTPRSVADIHDEGSLAQVRDWKRTQRNAGKTKQD